MLGLPMPVSTAVPRCIALENESGGGLFSLLERGGQAGDPAGVTLKGTAEDELFCHDCGWAECEGVRVEGGGVVGGRREVEKVPERESRVRGKSWHEAKLVLFRHKHSFLIS